MDKRDKNIADRTFRHVSVVTLPVGTVLHSEDPEDECNWYQADEVTECYAEVYDDAVRVVNEGEIYWTEVVLMPHNVVTLPERVAPAVDMVLDSSLNWVSDGSQDVVVEPVKPVTRNRVIRQADGSVERIVGSHDAYMDQQPKKATYIYWDRRSKKEHR